VVDSVWEMYDSGKTEIGGVHYKSARGGYMRSCRANTTAELNLYRDVKIRCVKKINRHSNHPYDRNSRQQQ